MSEHPRTVTIAGRAERVERVSARKASRAFALLKHINRQAKDLAKRVDAFEREWREEHVTMLTRAEARVRFPRTLVLDPETGAPVTHEGELVYAPSAIDAMTAEDWQATSDRYPVHEAAPGYAVLMYAFEEALDVAEAHVYRLLALLLMDNETVTAKWKDGSLDDDLATAADDLLDGAMADEVLELAVVCAEVLEDQFRSKLDTLGDRTGNLLRLFGMRPSTTSSTSPNGPTTSPPSSSTDTPSSSAPDGPPTSSSTPTIDSSSESVSSPTTPEPELEPTPIGGG